MAFNAYDVKIFLWKTTKLSSKACATFILKHPIVSCALLCLFLLYMSFPSFFWVFLYSFPPFVVIATIVRIYLSLRNGKNSNKEEKTGGSVLDKNSKSMTRVHSVRRRKAINIQKEDEFQDKVKDKTAIFSNSFSYAPTVDKSALVQVTPKEIQELKVSSSLVNDGCANVSTQNLKPLSGEESQLQSLEGSEDEEEGQRGDENKAAAVQWTEEDQKNVMDVGISESERNKRLESLIARRRSRKLLSLQVRRTLMNIDRNDPPSQLTSLAIPKNTKKTFPTSTTYNGRFSPSPGSAPSVLVPMRNPFDLPYDPQEEKLDLSEDSFQQEFFTPSLHKDMMFCRHESFSLGGFLPGEFNQSRDTASFFNDYGFRQNDSSQEYQASKLGDIFDRELTRVVNQEQAKVSKPESVTNTEEDHIKEVIQVHRNGTDKNAEEKSGEVQKKPIPDEDFNAMSSASLESGTNSRDKEVIDKSQNKPVSGEDFNTTSSSSSSSEDEAPYFKIDKEAVLRSLSSLARRNVVQVKEIDDKIDDPLSLDEHLYYADKTMKHHYPSYSIASDLQVEVSDISSPPLTIDENFTSYDEDILIYETMDMEKKISLGSEYLWDGSSNIFGVEQNGSSLRQVNEGREPGILEVGFSTIKNPEERNLPIEDKVFKEHSVNPFSSSSSTIAELRDSGKAVNKTVLLENIAETSQKSVSADLEAISPESSVLPSSVIAEQSSREGVTAASHANSSGKQAENIRSSEDSEERLRSIPERQKNLMMISTVVESHGNLVTNQHDEGEASSSAQTPLSSNNRRMSSNNPQSLPLMRSAVAEQIPVVQNSSSSPKSVLQPAFSVDNLSSFDHDNYQDIHQYSRNTVEVLSPETSHDSTLLTENSTVPPPNLQGSADSSIASTSGVESNNKPTNKQRLQEESAKLKEVASSSIINGLSSHETSSEQLKPIAETSSRCIPNDDTAPSRSSQATHPSASSRRIDEANHSRSSLSTSNELAEPSRISTKGTDMTESPSELRLHEDSAKLKDVASSSTHVLSSNRTPAQLLQPIQETSSRSTKDNDTTSSTNPEATHPTSSSRIVDEANNSMSQQSTHEASAPETSRTLTRNADNIESTNKQTLHDNNSTKLKDEVASSGLRELSSHATSAHERLKPILEATSRCLRNDNTVPSTNLEVALPTAISTNIDEAKNSRSPLYANEASTESLETSTSGSDIIVIANKQKLHENNRKLKEVGSSGLHELSSHQTTAEPLKPYDETSLRRTGYSDAISQTNLEAAPQTGISKRTDEENNSKSPLATNEESSKSQEKLSGKSITHNNSNTSKSSENHRQTTEDGEHKGELKHDIDRKGGTTSTSQNCSEKTKDEAQTTNTVSSAVQENENSKTEHDTKSESLQQEKKKT